MGDELLLTVADPTQEHRQLVVHLGGQYIGREATNTSSGTRVEIDLPQGEYAGQSVSIALAKRASF